MKRPYPTYDVLARWESPSFNDATREVLSERLERVPQRLFFTEAEWARLEAVVARLIPQPDRTPPIPITPWIDKQLQENHTDGFRYDDLPPQGEAWRRGLAGLEAESKRRFDKSLLLTSMRRRPGPDPAVRRIGRNRAGRLGRHVGATGVLSARCWCATVATLYYAHPVAWERDRLRRAGGAARLCPSWASANAIPWEASHEAT